MSGWVKIRRNLREWEWYDDKNATRLLVHLLISVNYVDKKWKNTTVKAGSMVFSWATLSENVGLSIQQTRTAMDKLKGSREATVRITNRYSVVTLVKWNKIQSDEKKSNKPPNKQITSKQQADNKQITTTKEGKNERRKEIKKHIESEGEINALTYLKSNSSKWEVFTMQNKKRILDWDEMLKLYSFKVDEEELKYDWKILISRLNRWMNSWEKNQRKNNSTETLSGAEEKIKKDLTEFDN